jgi:hypothetical protein
MSAGILEMIKVSELKNYLLVIFAVALINETTKSQCCSPGNPVSGSEYVGILPMKTLRTITFYRHSYSDIYYEGSEISDYQGTRSGYDFIGEVLSYGILRKLTAEAELGYYLTKYQDSDVLNEFRTHGFSNATLSLKYALFKSVKDMELTLGAGAKLPVSRKVFVDEYGVPYPQEIQPSTGAFGFVGQLYFFKGFRQKKWRLVVHGRYELNGYNSEDYRFGDAVFTSLFISRTLKENWSATLQFRNEYRWEDWQGETRYLVTGGDILYLSLQVSYLFKSSLTVSINGDIPVYRNYNGVQLGPKYAFGISLVKDFCL